MRQGRPPESLLAIRVAVRPAIRVAFLSSSALVLARGVVCWRVRVFVRLAVWVCGFIVPPTHTQKHDHAPHACARLRFVRKHTN